MTKLAFKKSIEENGYAIVKRVKDATSSYCLDCEQDFALTQGAQYWGWRKSQGLHDRGHGKGHLVMLYGRVRNG